LAPTSERPFWSDATVHALFFLCVDDYNNNNNNNNNNYDVYED